MMQSEFLWLDTAEWQAVGTIALVVITGIYVILTRRLAKSAAEAAAASQAGLTIEFESYVAVLTEGTSQAAVVVFSRGVPVWVHGVTIEGVSLGDESRDVNTALAPYPEELSLPIYLHPHQESLWRWTGPRLSREEQPGAMLLVRYSVMKRGEQREMQSVPRFSFS